MSQARKPQVILITGSNSGIGNATAKQAVAAGYVTYGGVRRMDTFSSVEAVGAMPILLDVTDEKSMSAAVREIEAKHGAVDVLINNAGYGQMGAIEEVMPEAWRRQFETNVFGLVRLTQLVLPAMRRQRSGHIINIGSAGGEFTFPLAGAYHATKYAVESISDALRFEVRPFGIRVTVIQPGPVSTPLATATVESIQSAPDSPYRPIIDAFRRLSQQSTGYITAEQVASTILNVMQTQRPRARYKIGTTARMMPMLHRMLPARLWDRMVARFYA